MNLELTTEEVAFREEMRKFFTTEFSPELRARAAGFGKLTREDIVAGQQILNAHGLAVPHWPVEWGGKDWTPVQRHIYSEEMQLASVPNPLPVQREHGWARYRCLRFAGAEGEISPRYGQRRYLVVPGFFGTRSRFGSRFTQDGRCP